MRGYNEYVDTIRRRLRNYKQLQATAENLAEEAAACRARAGESPAAPISKYGDSLGGGTGELNSVEAAAESRIHYARKAAKLEHEHDDILRKLGQLDRTMATLTKEDAAILRARYIGGETWEAIGYREHYSARWARDRAHESLKRMAVMIFGAVATSSGWGQEEIRFFD